MQNGTFKSLAIVFAINVFPEKNNTYYNINYLKTQQYKPIATKKRQDKVKFAEENPAEYAAERGPEVDYDPEPDFARGGIARMLGE